MGNAYELLVKIGAETEGLSSGLDSALGKLSGFKGLAMKALGGLAIGKFISDSINAGGELEQSLGGVETLFKESADKVKENAKNAFATSGLSANDYMQNVTSFSASLLQSVAGDTDKAADIAEMAMVDMADNANKMGTDMSSIQNAYQGFAKQNYTMLDNLKLGYGGTKTEMERLLADAEKFSGVEYNIDSLSDVYEAIHIIQNELDITGTTALEASETLQGSASAMKASFENLLGNLAIGAPIQDEVNALATTISTFLFQNLLPMIWNIISSLPAGIIQFIQTAIPLFLNAGIQFVTNIANGLTTGLPSMLEKGKEVLMNVLNGIQEYLPSLLSGVGNVIQNLISLIVNKAPEFMTKGAMLLMNLSTGIWSQMPSLVSKVFTILGKVVAKIAEFIPKMIPLGLKMIVNLAKGIWDNKGQIITNVGTIASSILSTFGNIISGLFNVGVNLIKGLWNGIKSVKDWILGKIKGFTSSVLKSIKGFFGIHSPSRVFRDEVGAMLGQGMALGIEDEVSTVSKAMQIMNNEVLDSALPTIDYGLNGDFSNSGLISNNLNVNGISANINLSMGGNVFRAFTENITNVQNKELELEMAYV